jgi:hypothetical protein
VKHLIRRGTKSHGMASEGEFLTGSLTDPNWDRNAW